jgi:hypothetical protein
MFGRGIRRVGDITFGCVCAICCTLVIAAFSRLIPYRTTSRGETLDLLQLDPSPVRQGCAPTVNCSPVSRSLASQSRRAVSRSMACGPRSTGRLRAKN